MQNTTNKTASCGAHFITIGGNVGAAACGLGAAGIGVTMAAGFGATGGTVAELLLPERGTGGEENLPLAAPSLLEDVDVVGVEEFDACGTTGFGAGGVVGVALAPIGGAAENRFSGVGSDMGYLS